MPIHKKVLKWLFDNGGPVLRYRLASMFGDLTDGTDTLREELLQNATVKKWLNNLKSFEDMAEQREKGTGLGIGGHSSFLHGSKNMNIEVVLPKLGQLGLHAGMPGLDERTRSWLDYLKNHLRNTYGTDYSDDREFHHKVYAHHDHRLIIACSLALAGYVNDESVKSVTRSRLDAVYETVKTGTYDIYEDPDTIKVEPANWKNHIVKHELLPDGNIRLPFVHDICCFGLLYPDADHKTKEKIDAVIDWLLAPEYQRLGWYAYIRYPSGRGKHVGDNISFPRYVDKAFDPFERKSVVLRCWQMAHFPGAIKHKWFQDTLNRLESFATERGTYLSPADYLTEVTDGGKWVYGLHMGLGEDRRSAKWRELESTFWMLSIKKLVDGNST